MDVVISNPETVCVFFSRAFSRSFPFAQVGICLCIVSHVLAAADIGSVFLVLGYLVIAWFYIQLCFGMRLKPAVVLFALVTGIQDNAANFPSFVAFPKLLHERNQRMHIISVRGNVAPNDKIAACCHIDIVSGLELPVSHMVFLHVHKGCVMIRFAEAVPISADVNIVCVLLELGKTLVDPFTQSLKRRFSFALS